MRLTATSLAAVLVALAPVAHSQVRAGLDLGLLRGSYGVRDQVRGTAYAEANRGVFVVRLNAVELNHEGVYERLSSTTPQERVGGDAWLTSSLVAGVSMPVWRGAGFALTAGGRLLYYDQDLRDRFRIVEKREYGYNVLTTLEAFVPGPGQSRLHARVEGLPLRRSSLFLEAGDARPWRFVVRGVTVGASVPLRF